MSGLVIQRQEASVEICRYEQRCFVRDGDGDMLSSDWSEFIDLERGSGSVIGFSKLDSDMSKTARATVKLCKDEPMMLEQGRSDRSGVHADLKAPPIFEGAAAPERVSPVSERESRSILKQLVVRGSRPRPSVQIYEPW
ncbi:unnamed protein product [Arabis nemorensis]|uniref:Uncharacterized protein n=1 Tax=Arabis nemorensis TaxID=586526 RepID=A0A565BVE7_9BRAS|nr:unnamed protein product [Arabis nemorensis]